MPDVRGVTPQEARTKVTSGTALLVCAYEDREKCEAMHLEGAITMQEFRARRAALPSDQEIIFYCA